MLGLIRNVIISKNILKINRGPLYQNIIGSNGKYAIINIGKYT